MALQKAALPRPARNATLVGACSEHHVSIVAFALTCSFNICEAQLQPLSYRTVASRYSTPLDRLVMISSAPDLLHIYDPSTTSDITVSLPKPPLGLAVSPDGLHAAVTHDGLLSWIDLSAASLIKTIPITGQPTTVFMSDTYAMYYLAGNGYTGGINGVNLLTGTAVTFPGLNYYYATNGVFDASQQYMYLSQDGVSPDDMEKATITNGQLTSAYAAKASASGLITARQIAAPTISPLTEPASTPPAARLFMPPPTRQRICITSRPCPLTSLHTDLSPSPRLSGCSHQYRASTRLQHPHPRTLRSSCSAPTTSLPPALSHSCPSPHPAAPTPPMAEPCSSATTPPVYTSSRKPIPLRTLPTAGESKSSTLEARPPAASLWRLRLSRSPAPVAMLPSR